MNGEKLSELLRIKNITEAQAGKVLFPQNAYPQPALKRVIKGEAQLDAGQMLALSRLTGVSISDLYGESPLVMNSHKAGQLSFFIHGYQATLDLREWTTTIAPIGGGNEHHIIHGSDIGLSDYLTKIKNLITK